MDRAPVGPDSLSYRSGGYRYILSFDEECFTVDCQRLPTYSKVTRSYRAFQSSWPLTKTVIRMDDDGYVEAIPHIGSLEVERRRFEEDLVRAVKVARNEEDGA
jgi:hypothetical protein